MAKTKSSAKGSKAAAPAKRAAPKPAAKPAPKAAPRKETATDKKMDWSSTIKKALQDKGGQPQWPGSGDAWKRKNKV